MHLQGASTCATPWPCLPGRSAWPDTENIRPRQSPVQTERPHWGSPTLFPQVRGTILVVHIVRRRPLVRSMAPESGLCGACLVPCVGPLWGLCPVPVPCALCGACVCACGACALCLCVRASVPCLCACVPVCPVPVPVPCVCAWPLCACLPVCLCEARSQRHWHIPPLCV